MVPRCGAGSTREPRPPPDVFARGLPSIVRRAQLRGMDIVLTHKGKPITDDDLAAIRALMGERAAWTRRSLSIALCERRGWVQENGVPRDAACRTLLLALHRAGHIELPAPRWACREPWRRW